MSHNDYKVWSIFFFQGEKVFYFIEPTEENLTQYEKWVSSARQSEMFFGDMVKTCYSCSVKPGQTLFIPTGTVMNSTLKIFSVNVVSITF